MGDIPPGQGRPVEVNGKKIALFNVDGSYYAIDDICNHRGGAAFRG
jgi:nitrite reductase/ring-hydroxylating ferredoxin subunit